MDRIIEVKVGGNYISKDSKTAGVRGEANVTRLRITFDEGWDGYAKTVTFWDARGGNPVERTLTTDLLENIKEDTRVYLVPIPKEPMTEAGQLTFVIDGYLDGKRQRSFSDTLEVKDAPITDNAEEPTDPTPTQAEQLQTQIEAVIGGIQGVYVAKEAIENMSVSAEKLSTDDEAFVDKTVNEGVVNLHFGLPKGNTGDSGVHVGETAPTDSKKNVWINPKGSGSATARAGIVTGKNAYEIALENGFEGTVEDWLNSLKGADYVLTPEDKAEIADLIKSANPIVEKSATLTASGWSGTAAPYTQNVSVSGITADTNGTVFVSEGATDAQFSAALYAMLRKTAQGANYITIKAYGEKPTTDIPLTVRIGG